MRVRIVRACHPLRTVCHMRVGKVTHSSFKTCRFTLRSDFGESYKTSYKLRMFFKVFVGCFLNLCRRECGFKSFHINLTVSGNCDYCNLSPRFAVMLVICRVFYSDNEILQSIARFPCSSVFARAILVKICNKRLDCCRSGSRNFSTCGNIRIIDILGFGCRQSFYIPSFS